MKTPFFTLAAVAAALAFCLAQGAVGPARAQEKPVPARPSPAPESGKKDAAAPERKTAPKPAANFFTGTVEALDETRGTITVKSRKGIGKDFVAEEKARNQMKNLKVGDRVVVKYTDGTALSVVKPGVKKKEVPPMESSPKEGKAPAPSGRK